MSIRKNTWPSLGVELEMPTAHLQTGATYPVRSYFHHLRAKLAAQGLCTSTLLAGDREYGLISARGLHSLDNGFNNLESSLGPIPGASDGLDVLARLIGAEIRDVTEALLQEEAILVNFSEHPCVHVDETFYCAVRAPKSIYEYWVNHRGWNHMSGFDAKAQNSPCTGVDIFQAIPAMNCLLALAPVFIALYANSPFENGRITECKENRLTLWPRLLDCSKMPGDRYLHRMPRRPFRNLADYLQWMFGPGTQMWFAGHTGEGKNPQDLYVVPGNPSLLFFLRGGKCFAVSPDGGSSREIVPEMRHLVYHQASQFTDCRLRYGFVGKNLDLTRFLAVLDERPETLEEFLEPHLGYVYLEGRAAGANFPDQELYDLDQGKSAASVAVSPSALQYGLVRNLEQTRRLVDKYPWTDFLGLREQAMRHALAGEYAGIRIRDLCAEVLEIAGRGLRGDQAWMLDYPLEVVRSRKAGADRALERYEQLAGTPRERMMKLILERRVLSI